MIWGIDDGNFRPNGQLIGTERVLDDLGLVYLAVSKWKSYQREEIARELDLVRPDEPLDLVGGVAGHGVFVRVPSHR